MHKGMAMSKEGRARRRCAAALALLAAGGWWRAPLAAESALDLPRIKGQLEGWLQDAGLAPMLELQKLRWGPRADDPAARWLMLELRFVAQGMDSLAAEMAFGQALQDFEVAQGSPLAEVLFFKLLHATQLPRRDLHVTVSVLEDSFAVLRVAGTPGLRFGPATGRVVRVPARLPSAPAQTQHRLVARVAAPVASGASGLAPDLPDRVLRFLREYFTRASVAAGRPPPRLSPKPLESDYVGLEVAGLRRLVITTRDHWERLQVSVELRPDAQGVRAVCYLDGGWATGLGQQLPAEADYVDMEKAYREPLRAFGDTLMAEMQRHLASGAP